MTEPSFEFYVAGVKFHELKHCINEVKVGDILMMVLEPSNKYDPNAVRLEFSGENRVYMVGYVPAKMSASVSASIMTGSPKCTVTEVNPTNKSWEQLKVEIVEDSDETNS